MYRYRTSTHTRKAGSMSKLKPLFLACAVMAFLGQMFEARAAILNVSGGQLTGAQNVDIDGTLFNVNFVDGRCLFGVLTTVGSEQKDLISPIRQTPRPQHKHCWIRYS